jgi:hypothetical protein
MWGRFLFLSLLWSLLLTVSAVVLAADNTQTGGQDITTASVGPLLQERDQLTDTIKEKESTMAGLQSYLSWRGLEAGYKQQLEDAKKRNAPSKEINEIQKNLDNAHSNVGAQSEPDLKASIDRLGSEIAALKKRRSDIESEMNRRFDIVKPKQDFITKMSFAFAALVGMVIIGFYLLAWIDEGLRREMFSRQSGIQFITLFSLVIAIILFGITGILESRELSALLGGLSGYILGRSTGPAAKAVGRQDSGVSGAASTTPTRREVSA